MIGWIILILAVCVFIGFGIWVILNWKKPMFPEGGIVTDNSTYPGYTAHVIFGPGVHIPKDAKMVAEACARAAWALNNVWRGQKKGNILEIAVYFRTEKDWLASKLLTHRVASYLGSCARNFGKNLPMPVMREKYMQEVIIRGEPVIHELCHELLGEHGPSKHDQFHVWHWLGKNESAQHRAKELFGSV